MKTPTLSLRIVILLCALTLARSVFGQSTWSATVGTSATTNWSDAVNWSPATVPGAASNVLFTTSPAATTADTIDNVVNSDFTINNLTFNNGIGQFHNTFIPAGRTQTVNGTTTVSFGTAADATYTVATVSGGGTLQLNGTFNVVNNGSTSSGSIATNDLSGLTNFIYNASGGTIGVGAGSVNRASGVLKLAAASNNVTAGTISVGTGSGSNAGNGATGVQLGSGTNIINVGTLNLVNNKNSGSIAFPSTAPATAGLRLRGVNGNTDDNSRANLTIGLRNQTGSGNTPGTFSLNGHPVDMKIGTLVLGQNSSSGSTANTGTGTLLFDTGTVDVLTINMGDRSSGTLATSMAVGNLTVGPNATLLVSNNISMGNQGTGISSNTVNFFGATVTVSNSIIKSSVNGIANLNLSNATLTVGGTIGTTANQLSALNVTNSTFNVKMTGSIVSVVTNLNGSGVNTFNFSSLIPGNPAQYQIIKYTTAGGDLNSFKLGTLPGIFQGYLSNNTANSSIDLVITNGPVDLGNLTWRGVAYGTNNGNWDINVTTNWTTATNGPSVYQDYNPVTFDDSATGTTNVTLTTTFTPDSVTVSNNSLIYTLAGPGKLSGVMPFTKTGTGKLILDTTGGSDYTGGFSISNGVVQVGVGDDGGSLGNGALVNNGILLVNKTNTLTVSGALSGTGGITNLGTGILNLAGAGSGFSGSIGINSGTVRLGNATTAGTIPLLYVPNGATLAESGSATNSVTMDSGATLAAGSSDFAMWTNSELTINGGTVTLRAFDPLNPTTSRNIQVDANLRGNGTIIVRNADGISSADGNQGVRFRGSNYVSDFTGTIVVTNNSKCEMQFTGSGPYSPVNTAKFVLWAGAYYGTNGLSGPTNGGYLEFNFRNLAGATEADNDFEIMGTGAVVLNGLGNVNGSIVTLGNLKVGNNQEIIGYRGASTTTNALKFNSVTLTGGTVSFSPHSVSFGAATQAGVDFVLNDVSETSASSLVMGGAGKLTLSGSINYSGSTTVSNGTLNVTGSKNGGAGITLLSGTLSGTGYIGESVTNSGNLQPGDAALSPFGSLTIAGNLTLNNGNTNTFTVTSGNLGSSISGVQTFTVGGTSYVQVVVNGFLSVSDSIPLINFSSAVNANTNTLQLLPIPGYTAHLVFDSSSMRLVIDHAIGNITWNGTTSQNTWNTNGTQNWLTVQGNLPTAFTNSDAVTFGSSGTNTVNITTEVQPGGIMFDDSSFRDLVLYGAGRITGSFGITLSGNNFGTVTIANTGSNDFTGSIVIQNGTLFIGNGGTVGNVGPGTIIATNGPNAGLGSLGFNHSDDLVFSNNIGRDLNVTNIGTGKLTLAGTNTFTGEFQILHGTVIAASSTALGATNGATIINTNTTLDVNAQNLGSEPVTVSGVGVNTNGAIINNATNQQTQALRFVTLAGDTMFGGNSRWDIRGNPAALLTTPPLSAYSITKVGSNQISLVSVTNIDSAIYNIDIKEGIFAIQTATVNVGDPNGTITVYNGAALDVYNLSTPVNKFVQVLDGGTITNENSTSRIIGQVTLNGTATLGANSGTTLVMSNNVVTGTPAGIIKSGAGTVRFLTNDFPAPSALLDLAGGTLDLNQANSSLITLSGTQTVRGNGGLYGSLTLSGASSLLTPGEPASPLGTLTISNALIAKGSVLLELNITNTGITNDSIVASSIDLTGAKVTVTNIGPDLVAGDSFRLFSTPPTGSYTLNPLPALTAGLAWTNTIAADGRIAVISTVTPPPPQPTLSKISILGGSVVLSGTNNNGTTPGTYRVLSSTNIALPLSNWTVLSTNNFDASGNVNYTNGAATGKQQFYILQVP